MQYRLSNARPRAFNFPIAGIIAVTLVAGSLAGPMSVLASPAAADGTASSTLSLQTDPESVSTTPASPADADAAPATTTTDAGTEPDTPAPAASTLLPSKPALETRRRTRDPLYMVPGETRLDGIPSTTFDSTSGKLEMQVCSFAARHGGRVWLAGPKEKTVVVDAKTILYSFGDQNSQIVLGDVTTHPFHVTVIGDDRGDGKPLLARVVWIERSCPVEAQFVKRHAGGTARTCGTPDMQVTRPMIYTLGRNFPVCLVQVKMSTVRVRVGLAWDHVGATESLGAIAHEHDALAAINGSYFDAYNHSAIKLPDNELICMGDPVSRAEIGTVLGFTPDGEARMALSPVADMLHRLDPAYPDAMSTIDTEKTLFWQRVTEGLGAGPRLVSDGEIALNPAAEGYHSAEVLRGVSMRSAVGITNNGWLLLVTTRASIPELAHIMKALGCAQAMNLDGGTSSGLWARGHYLRRPGRQLSNALLITHR